MFKSRALGAAGGRLQRDVSGGSHMQGGACSNRRIWEVCERYLRPA